MLEKAWYRGLSEAEPRQFLPISRAVQVHVTASPTFFPASAVYMNSARPLPGSSSCPPETLPDWDSIGCVSCHFMGVSEGGLE